MAGRRRGRWPPLLALAVTALLLATLVTARGGGPAHYPPAGSQAVTVYLVDNGFHTDLALPRAALAGRLASRAAAEVTDRPWVMVGWGDRRFFVEQGWSVGRALDGLRSLFAPGNPSAVRFDGLPVAPDLYFASGVHTVRLSKGGLARLTSRLDSALAQDRAGRPLRMTSPQQPHAGFFESGETFNLLHLCNHWTADLLSAAGLPTTPVLDTLPAGLWLDLKLRAGIGRPPPVLDKPAARA